jgi:hypothetical protein
VESILLSWAEGLLFPPSEYDWARAMDPAAVARLSNALTVTFGTCQVQAARVESIPMETRVRKVSWRRKQALLLMELACMVGLCGLGFFNIAITLIVLTLVSILHEELQSNPGATSPASVEERR